MNHQVGPVLRGVAGNLQEGPLVDVVAVLDALVLDAAAGVSDHHDALGIWLGERQNLSADRSGACAGGDGRLARHLQAIGRGQSRRHRDRFAVGDQRWAVGHGSDHHARNRLPTLTQFDPGWRQRLGSDWRGCEQGHANQSKRLPKSVVIRNAGCVSRLAKDYLPPPFGLIPIVTLTVMLRPGKSKS